MRRGGGGTSERVRIAPEARERAAGDDVFAAHPPPFDLTSDMLLAFGTLPVAPLRAAFPGVPFAAIGGRALLGTWFARVDELRWDVDRAPRRGSMERPEDVPYLELNVAILLRGARGFVPAIHATSELSRRLGRRYGMPKGPAAMEWAAEGDRARSRAGVGGGASVVRARAIGDGRGLATLVRLPLPLWTPPVAFPSGSWIRARLEGVERVRFAWSTERRLDVGAAWMPRPVRLWPVALLVSGLRMRLPAESERGP